MPVMNSNQVQQTNLILSTLHHFRWRISKAEEQRLEKVPLESRALLLEITTSNNINNNRFHGFHNFSNDEAFQSQRGYSALKIDL